MNKSAHPTPSDKKIVHILDPFTNNVTLSDNTVLDQFTYHERRQFFKSSPELSRLLHEEYKKQKMDASGDRIIQIDENRRITYDWKDLK